MEEEEDLLLLQGSLVGVEMLRDWRALSCFGFSGEAETVAKRRRRSNGSCGCSGFIVESRET